MLSIDALFGLSIIMDGFFYRVRIPEFHLEMVKFVPKTYSKVFITPCNLNTYIYIYIYMSKP